ncbi:hypothetical protein ABH944_006328 [Caballeronia udeis]|uniref:Uncharacterized protein n=1 Tax=Caballeronia udeis TaxID=1232866 RepID=A0ABW8MQN8_9BURK
MNDETPSNLSAAELEAERYDLLICAGGFETRATFIANELHGRFERAVAIGFDHNQCLSYEPNCAWFRAHGIEIVESVRKNEFPSVLGRLLAPVNDAMSRRIAIDISCFDRYRLAELVSATQKLSRERSLTIDFWYSVAKFEAPHPVAGRNEIAGPINRTFAGRFVDPSRPLALVAGLGYEAGKVVGAAEFLQATRVISFFPESPVAGFAPEVQKANHSLLVEIAPHDSLRYEVDDPRRTIAMLDSVVRGLSIEYNVVLLPGGPKIFVLACLLVQRMHPLISVWRVSSGASLNVRDAIPSGCVVGLRWMP